MEAFRYFARKQIYRISDIECKIPKQREACSMNLRFMTRLADAARYRCRFSPSGGSATAGNRRCSGRPETGRSSDSIRNGNRIRGTGDM